MSSILTERFRHGADAIAREVLERWNTRLIALVRRRLGPRCLSKEEPEDVVQSTYRSFFRRFQASGYEVGDWGDVWALLSAIAVRKSANRRSYYAAGRRDPDRERPVSPIEHEADGADPLEDAILNELVERLLEGFDPPEREIVDLSLQGFSVREIGIQLGRAERSVQRVREHVRGRLLAWNGDLGS